MNNYIIVKYIKLCDLKRKEKNPHFILKENITIKRSEYVGEDIFFTYSYNFECDSELKFESDMIPKDVYESMLEIIRKDKINDLLKGE